MALCVNGGHLEAEAVEIGDFKSKRGARVVVRMNICKACLDPKTSADKDEMLKLSLIAIEGARRSHGFTESSTNARAIIGPARYDALFPRLRLVQ